MVIRVLFLLNHMTHFYTLVILIISFNNIINSSSCVVYDGPDPVDHPVVAEVAEVDSSRSNVR